MATSEQNREDVTCSICVDVFREPVVLPCQHSFCRECLSLYADKSKHERKDETSCSSGSEDTHQVISCPVCRSPTTLGRDGVSGLPLNFDVAEIVETFVSEVQVEDNTPYCSFCEEENKAKAVKFCTMCGWLYCQDCLASLHPVRGPLKRHRLISSEEYVSQGDVNRDGQSSQQPSCVRHGQPLGIYCVPCRVVICMECLVDHPEHAVRDTPSAAEMDKPSVLNKTSELEKILQQTNESLSGFLGLHNTIQGFSDLTKAIDDQLTEKSAALKKHKVNGQKLSDFVQRDLVLPRQVTVKEMVQERHDVKAAALEKLEVNRQKMADSVHRDLVVPGQVTVKETTQERHDVKEAVGGQLTSLRVTKPTLKFTKTSNRRLRITDEGSVVKAENLPLGWWGAVTDGRFGAGRYYWQLQITCSPGCYCFCDVGVVQEGCALRPGINPGSNSWYIVMEYSNDKVRCVSVCDGEIKPDYKQERPHTGHHHLGVYLDCDQRSLTILDCGHNRVMATVRGLTVTQPLVPWVEFYCDQPASARLVTGDSATLPQVLRDLLNIS